MKLVVCIIGGAVLCGSFFITLWLIEPEARPPQRLEDRRISRDNDLPTATQNAGLVEKILAQRQPTRTPKDSEAREGERVRRDIIKAGHKTLAKKHHPDEGGSTQQMDALLRKIVSVP